MTVPTVAVIGLGCIGGSIVKALPGDVARVRGWSSSPEDCAMARALGHDVPDTSAATLADAAIVVIAVPVQAIAEIAASAIRGAPENASIFHCGGVQSKAALALDERTYARVRGSHPLDALMTWISQLPQLASTALAATFAVGHVDPQSVGPGARDTTRLAASAFEQWASLLKAQPVLLDEALVQLESSISSIRDSLRRGDDVALRELWDSAREWRRAAEPSA